MQFQHMAAVLDEAFQPRSRLKCNVRNLELGSSDRTVGTALDQASASCTDVPPHLRSSEISRSALYRQLFVKRSSCKQAAIHT